MIPRRRLHRAAYWLLPTGAVAVLVTVVCIAPQAYAAGTWSVTAHGSGVGQAAVMPMGIPPTVTVLPAAVRLDWAPSIFVSGREVGGYILNRQQPGTTAVVQVCTVVAPLRTCQDSPPAQQPVVYIVVPTDQLWRGPASAPSTPVTLPAPALVAATVTPSANPMPTATPSLTTSPTPSPAATPSPGPTLSPTASPSAAPTPTPTPPPSPS